MTEDKIRQALSGIKYPGFSRDIVSFGLVKSIAVNGATVSVELGLTTRDDSIAESLKSECESVLRSMEGVDRSVVQVRMPEAAASNGAGAGAQTNRVPGVGRALAVASGKGGVGKSTVSVNLACALSRLGERVGLLDCDIYGPSIPLMMGIRERPNVDERERIIPLESHGVKLMSIGFLVDEDSPVIWRGPMIVKTIQQFLMVVDWQGLDTLLIDLPPGTGDAQLTLCQTIQLDGGLIVTTPQEASLGVVRKGINMFRKVNAPVTGIVENMSGFTADDGTVYDIFGRGGGQEEAARQSIPFLGEIPIFTEIREAGDTGVPAIVSEPEGRVAEAFLSVARRLNGN